MFYKTQNGTRIGDLFMSLIHTCQLNGVNALDYLQTLTEHAGRLVACPKLWLPWTYRSTVGLGRRLTAPEAHAATKNVGLHACRKDTMCGM